MLDHSKWITTVHIYHYILNTDKQQLM